MHNDKIKSSAIGLRKQGFSYEEIGIRLKVSKSTIHLWTKDIILNPAAKNKLRLSSELGRKKGLELIAVDREFIKKQIQSKTKDLLKGFSLNPVLKKLFCALLYWCEGEKGGSAVVFINSDPSMVELFLGLFRSAFNPVQDKFAAVLHLHSYHNQAQELAYWANLTAIPKSRISVYNKSNSGKNKKKNYRGCISIRYYDSKVAKEIFYLYSLFAEGYRGVV